MKSITEILDLKQFVIAGHEYDTDHFRESIQLTGSVNDDFAEQPKLQAIYGFAYETAVAYAKRLEVELDRLYCLVDQRSRAEAEALKVKVTEKVIEGMVLTSVEYQEHQNRLLEAQHQAGLLKAAIKAIEARKDALVSVSANHRAENSYTP